jgi:hypothetical protein
MVSASVSAVASATPYHVTSSTVMPSSRASAATAICSALALMMRKPPVSGMKMPPQPRKIIHTPRMTTAQPTNWPASRPRGSRGHGRGAAPSGWPEDAPAVSGAPGSRLNTR